MIRLAVVPKKTEAPVSPILDLTNEKPTKLRNLASQPPPRPEDVVRTLKLTNLEKFAKAFERAANTAFTCENRSKYVNVYVLMLS